MKNNVPAKNIVWLFCFFSVSVPAIAQEMILPLEHNSAITKALMERDLHGNQLRSAALDDTLFLPFFDDFSRYTVWPSAERWVDSAAFINFNFPINPPSAGVATFDGLDKEGVPYNNSTANAFGLCDHMTSRAINLFNDANGLAYTQSDSIFLVFHYQRKGRGDNPESNDSLVVQFLNPLTQQWISVWKATGTTAGDTMFTKVRLSINEPDFRQNGFRFRFRNYGSQTGIWDIWNVDYVFLNKFLQPDFENIRDFAYVYQGPSLLDNYSSVPWKHFSFLSSSQQQAMVKPVAQLTVRNNNEANPFPIKVAGNSYDQYGNVTAIVGGGGLNSIQIPLNSNVVPPANLLTNSFFQDNTTGELALFHAVYEIGQTASGNIDDFPQNDTLYYDQVFHNYYAYDDGSAELGYGVSGAGSQLAYKFDVIKGDTLRAVNMFFAQLGANVTNQLFRLAIWLGNSAGPVGPPVYEKFNQSPNYIDSINGFYTYKTDDLFLPAGTYFFGFIQNNATILNLGLDMNTPADPSRKFINTNGAWVNSQLPGMWMIRPVFSGEPLNVGEDEIKSYSPLTLYPNPASSVLNIRYDNAGGEGTIEIRDVTGRLVVSTNQIVKSIPVDKLGDGVYSIVVNDTRLNRTFTARFLVSGR